MANKNGKTLPNGTVKMSPAAGQNVKPAPAITKGDSNAALAKQKNGNAKITPQAKTKLPPAYGKGK